MNLDEIHNLQIEIWKKSGKKPKLIALPRKLYSNLIAECKKKDYDLGSNEENAGTLLGMKVITPPSLPVNTENRLQKDCVVIGDFVKP